MSTKRAALLVLCCITTIFGILCLNWASLLTAIPLSWYTYITVQNLYRLTFVERIPAHDDDIERLDRATLRIELRKLRVLLRDQL